MVGRNAYELDVDEIVDAAFAIVDAEGFDAVSMRSVSARLGVSPVPLYNRIGSKAGLIEAMAGRLLADVAPAPTPDEGWSAYAERWAASLRDGLRRAPDARLIPRAGYVEASKPLVEVLRRDGMAADIAVRACRLLVWATVGFVTVEAGRPRADGGPSRRRRPGSDPTEVTATEADDLFVHQIGFVVAGIARDLAASPTS